MGERSQIYIKIKVEEDIPEMFLTFHNQWSFGFSLIEDVIDILNRMGLNIFFSPEIIKILLNKKSCFNLRDDRSLIPRTSNNMFLNDIIFNSEEGLAVIKEMYPKATNTKEHFDRYFKNLITDNGKKIQLLNDNDNGGALIIYNNYKETLPICKEVSFYNKGGTPIIMFYNKKGKIVTYDEYLEDYRKPGSINFDIVKESFRNILKFRYDINLKKEI